MSLALCTCRRCARSIRLRSALRIAAGLPTNLRRLCGRLVGAKHVRAGKPRLLVRRLSEIASSSACVWREDAVVLGIESSCDDTGVAVMRGDGTLMGEALQSQTEIHQTTGGIVPVVAADLHRNNLQRVTDLALEGSGLQIENIDIIAVTVGPGLALCLQAGLEFAKSLAHTHRKPVMPVHHMEAHALTPRMEQDISFPYLVLLVSGGHCILAIAHSPGQFSRLGESHDDSPGEAFDKLARWLALDKHSEVGHLVGGAAVERVSQKGDPFRHPLPHVMAHRRCCNFSFSGLKTAAHILITRVAVEENWRGSTALPGCEDVAASFQEAVCRHLLTRTHRAILYSQRVAPHIQHLVVSGGVASNQYLREKLRLLLDHYGFTLYCPPPHLCTDNGVMIAWSAIENWRHGTLPTMNLDHLDFKPKWPLGDDVSTEVEAASSCIKLPKIPEL